MDGLSLIVLKWGKNSIIIDQSWVRFLLARQIVSRDWHGLDRVPAGFVHGGGREEEYRSATRPPIGRSTEYAT